MATVGNRRNSANTNAVYAKDPIARYASQFKDVCESILRESGLDLFSEPQKVLAVNSSNETLKNFFVENVADMYLEDVRAGVMSHEDLDEMLEDAQELYMNDREAILEASAMGAYNPVIGMTFPLHKNIMMNNVFDKGAIPKVVAREPKFTLSMEQRLLIKPDGTEIDMFTQQNEMTPAILSSAPFVAVECELPRYEGDNYATTGTKTMVNGAAVVSPDGTTSNVLTAIGCTANDNVSAIATYISAVQTHAYFTAGDVLPDGTTAASTGWQDVWVPVNMKFVPAYGEYDRQIMERFSFSFKDATDTVVAVEDVLSGYTKKNAYVLTSTRVMTYGDSTTTNVIKKVRLSARMDTSSAMLNTCSVSWRVRTDIVEIPEAIPLNTTVSPEEVKDIGALYQVNQLSKILHLIKSVLGNTKDDQIKMALDQSFLSMSPTSKIAATFDMAPRAGYALDHIEWRKKTFMDAMDTHVTYLLQVLNDPNMTISVFGRPDLIRKITPTEYTYQAPATAGPVDLDFTKTVVTSDKRVYQFIGSDKLRDTNNLIVVLCPRNTDRIVYRIYDYQMYVSNEIRNVQNYALPAIHAFERWLFKEYQPVQGRIQVLNPTGLRYEVENTNPIEQGGYNDYNANRPYQP